jgi:hypothetical protein
VSFTWAVILIADNYFQSDLPPFVVFARNPSNVCTLFGISIVLCIWALHLINTIANVSSTQEHHAVEIRRSWLSLQLQPDYEYEEARKNLIETMVAHIETDDEYPMVLSQIEVRPHTLWIAGGYVVSGLAAIFSFQFWGSDVDSSGSGSATAAIAIMLATVIGNLVLHGLYVGCLMPSNFTDITEPVLLLDSRPQTKTVPVERTSGACAGGSGNGGKPSDSDSAARSLPLQDLTESNEDLAESKID